MTNPPIDPLSATVLLVENKEHMRSLIVFFLEHEGIKVLAAADREEALQYLETLQTQNSAWLPVSPRIGQQAGQYSPKVGGPGGQNGVVDLILLDPHRPAEGTQLVQEIRSRPAWKGIPILGISNAAEEKRVRRMLGGEIDDCLVKPFRPPQLIIKIKQLICAHREQHEANPLPSAGTSEMVSTPLLERLGCCPVCGDPHYDTLIRGEPTWFECQACKNKPICRRHRDPRLFLCPMCAGTLVHRGP